MKRFGNILWGIVFIAIGIIWGLNSLGYTNINLFFNGWWTLFIIVPGFIGLFREENKTGSIIFLIIGLLLLLGAQNLISFDILRKMIIPIILVIIGVSVAFGSVINTKVNEKIKTLNKNGLPEYSATFSGQKVVLPNEEFEGANIDAVFGGVDFDLRNAQFSEDKIINANAIFGGIELYVPTNVIVKVKSTPIFGGVSNKSINAAGENMHTIYVNAFCLFGGVDIK